MLSFFKKVLLVFGIVFGLIVILFIWAGISTYKIHGKFEDVAEPFIKEFLIEQSPWNYELAKPHLTQALSKELSDEEGTKSFNSLNKLGALESVDSIEWQSCSKRAHTSTGKTEQCNYLVSATYEKDTAKIVVGLSLENDKVKLMHLNVILNEF